MLEKQQFSTLPWDKDLNVYGKTDAIITVHIDIFTSVQEAHVIEIKKWFDTHSKRQTNHNKKSNLTNQSRASLRKEFKLKKPDSGTNHFRHSEVNKLLSFFILDGCTPI